MSLYKAVEFKGSSERYHVQCNDLVGTGRNWSEPAKILGIKITDLILKLKNEFGAEVCSYRKKDGTISFVGFSWDTVEQAAKWRSYINRMASKNNYQI